MKKKIISVLTALMVLSMSTTVFGATSPTTGTTTPVDTTKVTVAADAASAVKEVSGANAEVATEAEVTQAANQAATLVGDGEKANLVAVVNLTAAGAADENGNYNITITVPSLTAGTEVTIMHFHANGVVDYINTVVEADGKISFSVTSFSTFAVVEKVKTVTSTPNNTNTVNTTNTTNTATTTTNETTSPKTGAPVVLPMMAAICLAGAGVCTKKVKFN